MSLTEQIKQAGVIGCGGAGFPTDIKVAGKAEYLLLNGVECEPALRTDRYLMIHRSLEIVKAAEAVALEIGAKHIILGIKKEYTQEIEAMRSAIKESSGNMQIHELKSFYPAGDEHVVVYELTGRCVPPGGIPLDVGCVVSNVGTMSAVFDAMNGIPFTDKYLTVNGEVDFPMIVKAPVGTAIEDCLRQAGMSDPQNYLLIQGGPMMGKPFVGDEEHLGYVGKTTSSILVLKKDSHLAKIHRITLAESQRQAAKYCIQCSYCTMLCPRYALGHQIQPHKVMRLFAMGNEAALRANKEVLLSTLQCSQCGVCGVYACPMGLSPNLVNQSIREGLAREGIRPQKGDIPIPHSDRDYHKIPTAKLAARAGVYSYYHNTVEHMAEIYPQTVKIALKQGAGAPSEPVVSVGEQVEKGQLIAVRPEKALGSDIHASISGRILQIDSSIKIGG